MIKVQTRCRDPKTFEEYGTGYYLLLLSFSKNAGYSISGCNQIIMANKKCDVN
jgi:hypothetical protein